MVRSRFGVGPCMIRNATIVATRITALAIGATATITNRRLANSTAVATVPTAYNSTWGMKKRRKKADSAVCCSSTWALGAPLERSRAMGVASTMPTIDTTAMSARASPRTPEASRSASASSSARNRSTKVGTSTADSAPAAMSSKRTLETELEAW